MFSCRLYLNRIPGLKSLKLPGEAETLLCFAHPRTKAVNLYFVGRGKLWPGDETITMFAQACLALKVWQKGPYLSTQPAMRHGTPPGTGCQVARQTVFLPALSHWRAHALSSPFSTPTSWHNNCDNRGMTGLRTPLGHAEAGTDALMLVPMLCSLICAAE
jgi:hypothetical protein